MTEEMCVWIAVITGVVLFGILWVRLYWKGWDKKRALIARAKERGSYVEGTQVAYKVGQGDHSSANDVYRNDWYKVKYEYKIAGRTYTKKLRFQEPCRPPWAITVYYDPDRPGRQVADAEVGSGARVSGWFLAFGISLAAAILLRNLLPLLLAR